MAAELRVYLPIFRELSKNRVHCDEEVLPLLRRMHDTDAVSLPFRGDRVRIVEREKGSSRRAFDRDLLQGLPRIPHQHTLILRNRGPPFAVDQKRGQHDDGKKPSHENLPK